MLSPESDPSIRLTRNTESSEEVLDKCFSIVEDFISKLWLGMKERYALTDLSAGPTSYSEAPAESVFSVWERVSAGRSSLSIENTIALTRVAMEGPVASTKDSFELSKAALEKWPSHLGERCTTAGWIPEVISKTVSKIQSGKRK